MIPCIHYWWTSIVSQVEVDGADSLEPISINPILFTIDQIFTAAALLIVIAFIVSRVSKPRQSLFLRSPTRPNELREDSVAMVIMVYLVTVLALSEMMKYLGQPSTSLLTILITGNGGHLAGIIACLFVASRKFDGGLRRFLLPRRIKSTRNWGLTVLMLSIVALGICPLITEATVCTILWFNPEYVFTPHPTIKAINETNQPMLILMALWSGAFIIAPIAEEIFFRGMIQTILGNFLGSRWRAILFTSLAFGLIHFSQPYAIAALIFLAILIGYSYEKTGSILPPILIHALFNLKSLIWDAMGQSSM